MVLLAQSLRTGARSGQLSHLLGVLHARDELNRLWAISFGADFGGRHADHDSSEARPTSIAKKKRLGI